MRNTNSAHGNFRLPRVLAGLGIFFITISGCVSTPEPAPPPPVVEPKEEDVWSLLEKGEFDQSKKFFTGKTGINTTDTRGRTPLHIAAEAQAPDWAAFFIAMGAKPDLLDRQDHTPLSVSAELLDGATARVLIDGGANIHHPQPHRQTPAIKAISEGGTFLAAILTEDTLRAVDSNGRNILHLAAVEGNASAVEVILKAGNTLKKTDNNGKTALDIALDQTESKAHMEVAEKLILAGGVSSNPIYPYLSQAVRTSNYNIRIGDGITPLHFAAGAGYTGMVEYLLDKKADINVKTSSGNTPLHEAARSGNLTIMKLLISLGADVNAQDAKGNSPMHIGIPPKSHRQALELLVNNGANLNLRDEYGWSPLHIVITLNRDPAVARVLLDAGADVTARNVEGKTPLYLAVEEERVDTIGPLLDYGSDIFAADNAGITPFELALREKGNALPALITEKTVLQSDNAGNTPLHIGVKLRADIAVLGLILDKRTSEVSPKGLVNARNKEGDTSLHLAVRQDDREIGELLLSRGADIFAPNAKRESPLYLAFPEKTPPGKVREWILNPITITARDGAGNTILHYAAQWKLDVHIPLIIQKGVSPNMPNATGEPPLFMAVKVDSPSTISTLITAGAMVDGRDAQGNSGLHAAIRWDSIKAAQELINRGANINVHALNGNTPLHDAIYWRKDRMENLLVRNNADLEVRDNLGNTPFLEAVRIGYMAAVKRLADLGADPTVRNSQGDTPLHMAVAQDRLDLVNLLLDLGAKIHAKNILGNTPFQIAIITSPGMVSALLTRDRILIPDDDGHSPLHIAIMTDASPEIVKIIINMGARVSAIDADGYTPLRLALEQENWASAKLLADAGSNVFALGGDGKTPAEVALAKGRSAISALFSGKAISDKDSTGNTILHYAAHIGSPELISLLLELGANKNAKNISSESPGDVAVKWRRSDIAALLNS